MPYRVTVRKGGRSVMPPIRRFFRGSAIRTADAVCAAGRQFHAAVERNGEEVYACGGGRVRLARGALGGGDPDLSPEAAAYVAGTKFTFDSACASAAEQHIRKIRNAAKREYAWTYWRWMNRLGAGPEPDHPGLSYMGAQAVRHSLHAICTVRWNR